MRPIDAGKIEEATLFKLTEYERGRMDGLTAGIMAARNVPTFGSEVKKGYWIMYPDRVVCSECESPIYGTYMDFDDEDEAFERAEQFKKLFGYCPQCGAKMRG